MGRLQGELDLEGRVWWILRKLMREDSAHAVISHALRFRGYVAESRFFQMGETSEMACRKGV